MYIWDMRSTTSSTAPTKYKNVDCLINPTKLKIIIVCFNTTTLYPTHSTNVQHFPQNKYNDLK